MKKKAYSKKGRELKLWEKSIHMGIFDFSVCAVIGDYNKMGEFISYKFEDKELTQEFIENEDMSYVPRGKCFYRRGYVPVIWIPRKPRTAREHATLAHECLHAVYHLMEWACIPMTRDTEEVVTHSMAHLINEITK